MITPPPAIQAIWDEAKVRRTPVEWALRWIWNRPEVTVVLSGMNEESHSGKTLPSPVPPAPTFHGPRRTGPRRGGSAGKYREMMKVGCTGCGYCMPCPSNVMIPICFEEYNKMHLFGGPEEAKFRYALRLSGELVDSPPGYASRCVACGDCLDKCPQHIRIPEVLAQVAAEMEGPALVERMAAARRFFKIEA